MPSNQKLLRLAYFLIIVWIGFWGWQLAWPLSWASVPIFLGVGYITLRLIYEVTINRANVPTLATCFVARQKIADFLQNEAALRPNQPYHIVDMGSGRGELVRKIAKRIPHAKIVGLETAFFPYWQATLIQRWFGPSNLSYMRRDYWSFDCSSMDAVVLFLTPNIAKRMGDKLEKEVKLGGVVISYTYPLEGAWIPEKTMTFRSPFAEVLYTYRR